MRRDDRILVLALLLGGGLVGIGMISLQEYLSDDWRRTRECQNSYWSCDSIALGLGGMSGRNEFEFDGTARACSYHRAYESSARRAGFSCRASGRVDTGTCRTLDTRCELPAARLYEL